MRSVTLIEGRWVLQILLRLAAREQRFSDLRRSLPGISAKTLTERLSHLQAVGLVRHLESPPHALRLYALAPAATGLIPALETLHAWASDFAPCEPKGCVSL
jgi:DNA-binding HxlR family transcriptional regulator